jgi:hypothetical protein
VLALIREQDEGYYILDLSAIRKEVLYATLLFLYTDSYEDDQLLQANETRSCDLNALVHN